MASAPLSYGSGAKGRVRACGKGASGSAPHVRGLCNSNERTTAGDRTYTTPKRWTAGDGPRDLSAKGTQDVVAQALCSPREVQFVVPVKVSYGDCVKVVGNESVLGSWDCSRAIPLQWNEGHIWTRKVDLNPGPYEFKCVVAASDGQMRWEPGSNRSIEVPLDVMRMEVACEWWNTEKTSSSAEEVQTRELMENNLLPMKVPFVGKPAGKDCLDISGCSSKRGTRDNSVDQISMKNGKQKREYDVVQCDCNQPGTGGRPEDSGDEESLTNRKETNTSDDALPGAQLGKEEDVAEGRMPSDVNAMRTPSSSNYGDGSSRSPWVENHVVATPPGFSSSPGLKLTAAGHIIPHVAKTAKGGEDAYFVSSAGLGGMGVADGVGSWAQEGVDPVRYPRVLIGFIARAFNESDGTMAAKEALIYAQERAVVLGSCTACVGLLRVGNVMEFANVGDCGFRIVRKDQVVEESKAQVHGFNHPYQLSHSSLAPGDSASDADVYKVPVKPGDVIVMGTDGLLHNVWNDQLGNIVGSVLESAPRTEMVARSLATAIARAAHKNAQDPEFCSPWTAECEYGQQEQVATDGEPPESCLGGKMDDCTVVVGFVDSC